MPLFPPDTTTARLPDVPQDARRVFGAVLEGWASDVLRLRTRGLDRPSRREGTGGAPLRARRTGAELGHRDDAEHRRPSWAA